MHPPLESCRHCGGSTNTEPVSGHATVFSFIVVQRAAVPGFPPPYVTGVVELDEQVGLRMTGVLLAEPETISIGMRVRACIRRVGDSAHFAPSFEPLIA
jgi:uncharacterized OB-fold protein